MDRTGGPGATEEASGDELQSLLLGFLLDMCRGVEEFRRAYGLNPLGSELAALTPATLAEQLRCGDQKNARRTALAEAIREIKLHHASLLEGYQEATHTGARQLLDTLDPEILRAQFEDRSVRVGWLRLPCRFRPLLIQAIWEEFLRRFGRLRRLEPVDYERYFHQGFRQGYDRFFDAHRKRRAGASATCET